MTDTLRSVLLRYSTDACLSSMPGCCQSLISSQLALLHCSSSWSTVGRRSPFGLAMVALDRRLWVIGQQTRYGLSIETKTNQISQSWCDDVSQPLGRALHPIFAREAPRTLINESACFKRTRKIQNHDTNHLLNAKVVQHHLKE